MKKTIFTAILALAALTASADEGKLITLDLTKATTELEFDAQTGAWTGTFDDDEEAIDSQCFSFVKTSMGFMKTWWGFTASNSSDNAFKTDFITYQYSGMPKGGIVLNADGTVKLDSFGAPEVSADVPYLIGYYNAYMSRRPTDMLFAEGKSYEPQGVYVALNSYAFYSVVLGDAMARAFTNGDVLTLTIHGVAPDESEKTLDVALASFKDGELTLARGWKYVDLTSLGTVNEMYFTMSSTDSGAWGMNTPGYFCMDKLTVKESSASGIASVATASQIAYDRASHTVSVPAGVFATVTDVAGHTLMSTEEGTFDVSSLPAGIYIVRSGNSSLKIIR